MRYLTLAVFLLVSISFVSAYYPGDTITIPNDFGVENLLYTFIENSTAIDVNVSVNSTNVSIFFPFDMAPDSFTIVFIEEQTKEVVKEVHVSGGSSRRTVIKEVPVENCTIVVQEIPQEDPKDPINISEDEPGETEKEFDKRMYGVFLMLFVVFCMLMFWLYIILKNNKKFKKIKKAFRKFISSFSS